MVSYYKKRSRPSQLYLDSKSAKSYMFDQYQDIAKMPSNNSREQAHKQWRNDCGVLLQKLQKKPDELGVKLLDR